MARFSVICMRICGKSAGSFSYSGYSVMPNSVMARFDCSFVLILDPDRNGSIFLSIEFSNQVLTGVFSLRTCRNECTCEVIKPKTSVKNQEA